MDTPPIQPLPPETPAVNTSPAETSPIDTLPGSICRVCHTLIPANAYFCPNCGAPVKEKGPSTDILVQIKIYLISFCIPPVGFWYGYKYLKQGDEASKRVAWIAMILTTVSLVGTIWLTVITLNAVSGQLTGGLGGGSGIYDSLLH